MGGRVRCVVAAGALLAAGNALAQTPAANLADLSLEELGKVEVTSVSGRAQPISGAAASIYVITAEDIRRSGATTLPEVLRLAPNLQVARLDTGQYAISARGFNSSIANKLLVLIDGRTVYTPLFSGVFWDMQDVMLQDVERIEVISGPGGTLWGTNAVNGVINVITRPSGDTQGALGVAYTGNRETGAALRYGGSIGEDGNFRVYAKGSRQQNTQQANGAPVADGWDRAQAGFRGDWGLAQGAFTLQGDTYSANAEQRGMVLGMPLGRIEVSGYNLLARWSRQLSADSDLRVQAYVDHADREDFASFSPLTDIYDLEVQHAVAFGAHKLLWGGGYRHARDEVADGVFFGFLPDATVQDWANIFAQDEIALSTRVSATLGIKFEHNDYTGTEPLPSLRLAWKRTDHDLVWAAVSRAVRAPARLDRDFYFFPPSSPIRIINGGPNFVSEVAKVYELGYRAQPAPRLSYSVTAFQYDWDKLRSGEPPPAQIQNMIDGRIYGVEAWGSWQATPAWRLSAGLTTLREHLQVEPGSTDPVGPSALGDDADYQWMLRSSLNIAPRQELDVGLRYIAALPDPAVPAYTAIDLRYAWHVTRVVEVSLTVQNLFDPEHPEFGDPATRSEIPRSTMLQLRWGL